MTKYDLFTEVFNPSRGMVEVFLGSIYADSRAEAVRLGRKEVERGEKAIVRVAKQQWESLSWIDENPS